MVMSKAGLVANVLETRPEVIILTHYPMILNRFLLRSHYVEVVRANFATLPFAFASATSQCCRKEVHFLVPGRLTCLTRTCSSWKTESKKGRAGDDRTIAPLHDSFTLMMLGETGPFPSQPREPW